MFEKNIYEQYGLYCDEKFSFGQYEGFRSGEHTYVLMPSLRRQDHLRVQMAWATELQSMGIPQIAELVPDVNEKAVTKVDGMQQLLFRLPQWSPREGAEATSEGETLALIHAFSRGWVPEVGELHLYGRWLSLWEARMEQLEAFQQTIAHRLQKTAFDEQFLYTFPYYLGRAETAMQWLVEEGREQLLPPYEATITHTRFTPRAWMVADEHRTQVKMPLSFVYDHPARDIGEQLRYWYEKDDEAEAADFLQKYTHGQPLPSQTWALVGARLLFPLSYIELVEEHYMNEGVSDARSSVSEEPLEMALAGEERYMKHISQCLRAELPEVANAHWFTRERLAKFFSM
ncbi:spore coat putative kinase YutH [Natribacillus halophilus]|uniref:spore coat putative kinase YutH n=1 Tax=Natribacillus halophilus TaxID=549003 RepID=UPI0015A10A48|nr:spore coat protein YutH [Natribacillus halophilus]